VLGSIFIPLGSVAHRKIFGRFFELVVKRKRTEVPWRVSVTGSAEEPLRSLVFDEFVVTLNGLRDLGVTGAKFSSVGSTSALLFTPLSLADLVGPNLVVQGFDVSQIAAIVRRFRDYFSYGFELRVDTVREHAYVYATLRWGGRLEDSWQIPSYDDVTEFEYREIGRELAFTIYGDRLVRR
jgi:hypothetical protein